MGDARNLRRRLAQHARGNVEASALRKHVAGALGFGLRRERRPSGSTRVRIDAPDPKAAEAAVTAYLAGGAWRWAACPDYATANALQWLAIEHLEPVLNRDRRPAEHSEHLLGLLHALTDAPLVPTGALDTSVPQAERREQFLLNESCERHPSL